MKINAAFFAVVFALCSRLYAQELQVSFGAEAGFGVYKVENEIAFGQGYNYLIVKENTTSSFFAPGLSYMLRAYAAQQEGAAGIGGIIFRGRTVFAANYKTVGTVSSTSNISGLTFTEKVSETTSPFADDIMITFSDMSFGPAFAFVISDRVRLCLDYGLNVTWMSYEDFVEHDTSDYLGFGLFSQFALQVHLSKTMYLELGITPMLTIFSSLKGEINIPDVPSPFDTKIKYEDSGRWDFVTAAAYLHIGWRLDEASLLR